LASKIDQLLEADLRKSQLQIQISELAQTYRLTVAEVWKIYRTREQELEQEADLEDTAAQVEQLLAAQKAGLDLSEILPEKLAAPIKELAAMLNLKPECYLAAALTQVSSLFKVGSQVMLNRKTDYYCTPNYFAALVGESSQKKSPIKRAIIDRPMQLLREKAREEFRKAQQEYEEELAAYKSNKKKSPQKMNLKARHQNRLAKSSTLSLKQRAREFCIKLQNTLTKVCFTAVMSSQVCLNLPTSIEVVRVPMMKIYSNIGTAQAAQSCALQGLKQI
jgi:hypothetical protein